MKKILLMGAIGLSVFSFAQEKTSTQKIFDLSNKLKKSNNQNERDSLLGEMNLLRDGMSSTLEKNLASQLINVSKELSDTKKNFIPANDISLLSKEDLKKFKIENDKFTGNSTISPSFMYLNPTIRIKLVVNDNTMAMYLINSYEGSDWLFMDNATLLIDGQKFEYKLTGDNRDVGIGKVYEQSIEIVNADLMKIVEAIANSKNIIEVRFAGNKGFRDFKLPEKTKDRFAGMLNIYNKLKK